MPYETGCGMQLFSSAELIMRCFFFTLCEGTSQHLQVLSCLPVANIIVLCYSFSVG